jgi:uncharacterized protein YdaU (DUF1376 family)
MRSYFHNLGDWSAACAHLSWDEDMAYTQCIRAYYLTERPLPLDPERLAQMIGANTTARRDALTRILREYFHRGEDGYRNKRCDEEISKSHARARKSQVAAHTRWGHPSSGTSEIDAPSNAPGIHAPSNIFVTNDRPVNGGLTGSGFPSTPSENQDALMPGAMPTQSHPLQSNTNTNTTAAADLTIETAARQIQAFGGNFGYQINIDEARKLVSAGYSLPEFVEAITVASSTPRKPWSWVLARVAGRHGTGQEGPKSGPGAPEDPRMAFFPSARRS